MTQEQLEAVRMANAYLNEAGLPTLADLERINHLGCPETIGFDRKQFAAGYNYAMGLIFNHMRATLEVQRRVNDEEFIDSHEED